MQLRYIRRLHRGVAERPSVRIATIIKYNFYALTKIEKVIYSVAKGPNNRAQAHH